MRYDERDDGELLELAQAGWAPAYAVLVHRHAPALLTAFADDPDPLERVTDVFVRAMRQLPERDPAAPVAPWFFALAGRPVPDTAPAVDEETLDPVWRQLAIRWPDGRHVHRQRPVTRRLVTVVGAIALGIAVPTIVLGIPRAPADAPAESVRAQPLEDEPAEEAEPEELPSFEFPDVGDGGADPPSRGTTEPDEPAPTSQTRAPAAPTTPSPPVTEEPTGDDTTGDNTTGDNTTGDDTTGDNTTGDNTTGDDTTGDDTTGDDTTGDDTTGDDTTGDDTTGDDSGGGSVLPPIPGEQP